SPLTSLHFFSVEIGLPTAETVVPKNRNCTTISAAIIPVNVFILTFLLIIYDGGVNIGPGVGSSDGEVVAGPPALGEDGGSLAEAPDVPPAEWPLEALLLHDAPAG